MYTKKKQLGGSRKTTAAKRKRLINRCDKLYSRAIKLRDRRSLYSGKTQKLQCSHLIPRGHWQYRWDMRNAITLTAGEHLYGWHGIRADHYRKWLREELPDSYTFMMNHIDDIGKKPTIAELEEMAEVLQSLVSKYEDIL